MPTCASRSDCSDGDAAVSEVVGYLLVFGILSAILILSMVAFNLIQDRAEENVAAIEGESIAQRVASAVVNAALFVEDNYDPAAPATAPTYLQPIDLPLAVQGRDYSIALDGVENQVEVTIDGLAPVTAPLFSAGAPTNVDFCASTASAGRIIVSFDVADEACIKLLED